MTAVAHVDGARTGRVGRPWLVWRIAPLNELTYRVRMVFMPVTLAVEIYLYYRLWTAAYTTTASTASLDVHQTVTYSALALLVAQVRWSSRVWSEETIPNRIRNGTIVYWFLRPIPPARYYLFRAIGDLGYGAAWAVLGYTVTTLVGITRPPASWLAGATFLVTVVLGQVILYYLGQIVELYAFWLISVNGLSRMYSFVQDLLSGVFIPLWFLPAWLSRATSYLPFSLAVNDPISLYIGRIPLSQAPTELARQGAWILILAVVTRVLWACASRRVTSQGG